MKRLIAIASVMLLISASFAVAGPKGSGGGKGAFRSSPPAKTFQQPAQPQTGTIKDLGVNPTSKSPGDTLKNRPAPAGTAQTPGGPASAQPTAAPTAGFFGSSWFGSGWMNWAILGYLFGRHTSRPDEAKIKEKEQAKQKEQSAQKEQAKEGSEAKTEEQPKEK